MTRLITKIPFVSFFAKNIDKDAASLKNFPFFLSSKTYPFIWQNITCLRQQTNCSSLFKKRFLKKTINDRRQVVWIFPTLLNHDAQYGLVERLFFFFNINYVHFVKLVISNKQEQDMHSFGILLFQILTRKSTKRTS